MLAGAAASSRGEQLLRIREFALETRLFARRHASRTESPANAAVTIVTAAIASRSRWASVTSARYQYRGERRQERARRR